MDTNSQLKAKYPNTHELIVGFMSCIGGLPKQYQKKYLILVRASIKELLK